MKKSIEPVHIVYGLIVLVGLITLGSFILSYAAQYAVFRANSPHDGVLLAMIWPLLIDMALVLFIVSQFVNSMVGGSGGWWWWSMIALYTGATVYFNLVYAEPTWTGMAVALVKPVTLFIASESMRMLAKHTLPRVNGGRVFGLFNPDTYTNVPAGETLAPAYCEQLMAISEPTSLSIAAPSVRAVDESPAKSGDPEGIPVVDESLAKYDDSEGVPVVDVFRAIMNAVTEGKNVAKEVQAPRLSIIEFLTLNPGGSVQKVHEGTGASRTTIYKALDAGIIVRGEVNSKELFVAAK